MLVDLFMLYQFLRRLVQPFDKWDAFKTGVIDKDGNIIVTPSNRTVAQKDSFGKFDLLVLRLKNLLAKVPGGRSRLGTFAAALMLIKEQQYHDANDQLLQESLEDQIKLLQEEGAPTNSVGGGNIAGTDDTPPVAKFLFKKKKKQSRNANTITDIRTRSDINEAYEKAFVIIEQSGPLSSVRNAAQYLRTDLRKKKFLEAIDAFEAALKDKQIYNAEYKEHYSYGLSRGLEEAYGALKHVVYDKVFRENQFADDPDSLFSINSINKFQKHFSKLQSKYPKIVQFLNDIAPIVEANKQIKQYIIKGRKPSEKQLAAQKEKASFDPKTKDKLETLFRQIGNELKTQYHDYVFKTMMSAVERAQDDIVGEPIRKMYTKMKMNPFFQLFKQVFKPESSSFKATAILDSNYKSIVEKQATYATEMFVSGFIEKNALKMNGIIKDRKISELKHSINKHSLTGSLVVNLEDDSGFTMTFNVITKVSKNGKWFNQFPTRFTNVVVADGTRMRQPSESKMKSDF